MLHYFETSAKTGVNSKKLFVEAAKVLYKDFENYRQTYEISGVCYIF